MSTESDYALFGLQPDASTEELKTAYRDLVKVWHPDRFGGNVRLQRKAQEKLKEINLAYERLSSVFSSAASKGSYRAEHSPPPAPPPSPPPPRTEATSTRDFDGA